MKANSTDPEVFESTYALIVRSEEKQRSRLETLVYTLLIMSSLFAVSQFGRQAMTIPASIVRNSTVATATTQHGA
ncbi:MAG: hypothetical protein QOG67_3853 [Verrucomicrobiota bacterium]|jgi:hypothetical protein